MKTCKLITDNLGFVVQAKVVDGKTTTTFSLGDRVRIRENCLTDGNLQKKYHVSGLLGTITQFIQTGTGEVRFGLMIIRKDTLDHMYVRFEDIESRIIR